MISNRLFRALAVVFILCAPLGAVETKPDTKKEDRALAYEQQRLRERFNELEKKMTELAEMLKEKEPAAAAKLTAAVKASRENLVAANMQAIVQALMDSKLTNATEQSAKVVEELHKLLSILSESERTLDSLQKELERLQNQLAALQDIIKQEAAQQKQSEEIARALERLEKNKNAARDIADLIERQKAEIALSDKVSSGDKEACAKCSGSQQSLARETKDFSERAKDAEQAKESLVAAQEQMQKAADKLKATQKDEARVEQKRALESLEKAQKQMDEHRAVMEKKLADAQNKFDAMKQAQQSTREQASKLAESIKQTNDKNSPAAQQSVSDSAKSLDAATGDMKNAEQNLGEKKAPDASQNQQAALDKLKTAEQALQEAINQAQTQQLIQIETVLREMLEKQVAISADTTALDTKLAKAARVREDELKLKELSSGEAELAKKAEEAIGHLKKEGTTAVFPTVLGETRDDLKWVVGELDKPATGKTTQARQKQIEENLAELIAAMQKERIRRQVMVASNGGGGQCQGSLVPSLAELRMLKKMQLRVNDRTDALDAEHKGRTLSKEQEAELRTLTQRQAEVEKLTHDFKAKLEGGCKKCGQQH